MGRKTKTHREHTGAKNSDAKSGYYGKRADAKADSKKSRRKSDLEAIQEAFSCTGACVPSPQSDDYVDVDGSIATFRRADGTPFACMPADVWLALTGRAR